ncbi:hypothetical protein GOODEAATRI_022993 [Goodea atripinnis]|uniref:Gasdermin pore forming domain-containing protein n=1 Tax=Goodea atripinnis TaxID=208336 RepID=A0ABV0NF65_9TELE
MIVLNAEPKSGVLFFQVVQAQVEGRVCILCGSCRQTGMIVSAFRALQTSAAASVSGCSLMGVNSVAAVVLGASNLARNKCFRAEGAEDEFKIWADLDLDLLISDQRKLIMVKLSVLSDPHHDQQMFARLTSGQHHCSCWKFLCRQQETGSHRVFSVRTEPGALIVSLDILCRQTMFVAETKAMVRNTGAEEDLISNCNLNKKMDILTLVRVKRGTIFQYAKYKPMNITLPELLEEEDFSPEFEEQVLVKDFKTWVETSSSGKLDRGHKAFGEAEISADCDSVDGLAEPVSIKKKMVSLPAVRKKFSGREIKGDTLKLLKLKERDKLAIVYETVYNSGPVTIIKKSKKDGCISASFHKMANLMFKGNSKEDTTFTVPENSTFAFSLVEVLLEDGTMEISLESWTHKRRGWLLTFDLNLNTLLGCRSG